MHQFFLHLLSLAYGSVGIVALIAYFPTIKDLLHHKKKSANTASFIIWTATSGISFLYSIFVLPDPLFRFVSGVNFLACATVSILSLRLGK